MVWALFEPDGGGDFSPDADFTDRDQHLEAYFNNVLTDEERLKFENGFTSFRSRVSRKFSSNAGPLDEHEKPKELKTYASYSNLGSIISLKNGLLAVDETLKEIIESLEPGAHQFWPIRITMPKGKEYPVQYYGIIIGQFFDSLVPEQSSEEILYARGSYEARKYSAIQKTKAAIGQIAMNSNVFSTAHLWREKILTSPNIIISDALKEKIDNADLRMFKNLSMKVVEA